MAFKMKGMDHGAGTGSAYKKDTPKYKPFVDYKHYEGPAGWLKNTAKVIKHKIKGAIKGKDKDSK